MRRVCFAARLVVTCSSVRRTYKTLMSKRDSAGYYALLGLAPDASPEQVKAAYHAALKAADSNPGAVFIRKSVETAYGVLGDPASRGAYDCEYERPPMVSSVPHVYSPDRDPRGFYQILGVSMDATQREISQAYHRRTTPGPDCILDPEQVMTCHHAFQVLADPVLRRRYDPLWKTHLPEARDGRWGMSLVQISSDSLAQRIEFARRLDEHASRQASSGPAAQRRVVNSPFGCLSLLVAFTVLLVLL